MSVNLSSVSGGASVPLTASVNSGTTPPAKADTAAKISAPAPIDIPIAPKKPIDFSAQVNAQQQALQRALEELNQQAAQSKLSVGFNLDKASGMQYVQVTNAHSGEVMMQFPSTKMLDIAASIEQLKGMLYNKKA
jgi:uncharacterized FlaG/YvyC family protein